MAGASPSEPHTSVTALRTPVCMLVRLLVWTDHLLEILTSAHLRKIIRARAKCKLQIHRPLLYVRCRARVVYLAYIPDFGYCQVHLSQ